MSLPPTTPIIIGVADLRNKPASSVSPTAAESALEPAELILRAIRLSLADVSLPLTSPYTPSSSPNPSVETLLARIDSLALVRPWTWAYHDLPGLLACHLKIAENQNIKLHTSPHGGNQPARLVDEAARAIARGECRVAVVAGGEALASLAACQKAGLYPPPGWTAADPEGVTVDLSAVPVAEDNPAARHAMGLPIHVYPMYENAFRAHLQQTQADNHAASAAMYARFDAVACAHQASWRYGETPRTEEEIGRVEAGNRMVCWPYPLLMNAFNTVNLAAAVVLTSVATAREMGVPEEKWVYVRGGAGTAESANLWQRPNYFSSPAIGQSLDAALRVAGLARGDMDCFDLYSCFPIVPKLACHHLGLDPVAPEKPITLLGGLTSFGGAGNNYSMHAIAEMARQIRTRRITNGLVLANGGVLTYQHAVCLSAHARTEAMPYPAERPLPEVLAVEVPRFVEGAEGMAVVETYTVEFSRNGTPAMGLIVGRLVCGDTLDGARFLANHGDARTLRWLVDPGREPVGGRGVVRRREDGRNLFFWAEGKGGAKL